MSALEIYFQYFPMFSKGKERSSVSGKKWVGFTNHPVGE